MSALTARQLVFAHTLTLVQATALEPGAPARPVAVAFDDHPAMRGTSLVRVDCAVKGARVAGLGGFFAAATDATTATIRCAAEDVQISSLDDHGTTHRVQVHDVDVMTPRVTPDDTPDGWWHFDGRHCARWYAADGTRVPTQAEAHTAEVDIFVGALTVRGPGPDDGDALAPTRRHGP